MKKYETIVVFDPEISEERVQDELKKFETLLKQQASNIVFDRWGKKELSYRVGKKKIGNYVNIKYDVEERLSSDPKAAVNIVGELVGLLRISDRVIKFQTHRLSDRVRKFKGNPKRKPMGEFGDEDSDPAELAFN